MEYYASKEEVLQNPILELFDPDGILFETAGAQHKPRSKLRTYNALIHYIDKRPQLARDIALEDVLILLPTWYCWQRKLYCFGPMCTAYSRDVLARAGGIRLPEHPYDIELVPHKRPAPQVTKRAA